jgi:hypothetical protein
MNDEHASCREHIARAYRSCEEKCQIKEILLVLHNGDCKVLQVVRIDSFEDGLRIVVR